jgi:hypothetical protein
VGFTIRGCELMKIKIINSDVYFMIGLHLNSTRSKIITYAWAKKKGDWWYEKDPSNAKFFDVRKSQKNKDEVTTYGIYIGRMALAFLSRRTGR